MRHKGVLALVLAAALGVAAVGLVLGVSSPGAPVEEAQIQVPAPVQEGHEPPVPDPGVAHRMRVYGETEAEARQAIAWEGQSGKVIDTLSPLIPTNRLAGVWIQQERWTLVISLTGDTAPADLLAAAANAPIPVDIRTGAALTEEQLEAVLAELRETHGAEGFVSKGGNSPLGGAYRRSRGR